MPPRPGRAGAVRLAARLQPLLPQPGGGAGRGLRALPRGSERRRRLGCGGRRPSPALPLAEAARP